MILHTIIPYEGVFGNSQIETDELYDGKFEVICKDDKKYISRLISTNPQDFLNPDNSPGNELKL